MTKKEFLEKYDNKKPYGWVCYASQLCPPMVYTKVLAIGMTKEEAEANAVKKWGESIHCDGANRIMPIDYSQVTEAAYRKLKNAKTLDKFHTETYEGISVKAYDED